MKGQTGQISEKKKQQKKKIYGPKFGHQRVLDSQPPSSPLEPEPLPTGEGLTRCHYWYVRGIVWPHVFAGCHIRVGGPSS